MADLPAIFQFSPDDLAHNRRGELSAGQRAHFERTRRIAANPLWAGLLPGLLAGLLALWFLWVGPLLLSAFPPELVWALGSGAAGLLLFLSLRQWRAWRAIRDRYAEILTNPRILRSSGILFHAEGLTFKVGSDVLTTLQWPDAAALAELDPYAHYIAYSLDLFGTRYLLSLEVD
ncbi:MAG: hypothetical protein HYZ26_08320 [Chloroflexi bacterium]|nr:hypothetical protein [Chloroflexota bacterium]